MTSVLRLGSVEEFKVSASSTSLNEQTNANEKQHFESFPVWPSVGQLQALPEQDLIAAQVKTLHSWEFVG